MAIHDILTPELNLNGDWVQRVDELYAQFTDMLITNPVKLNGKSVLFDRRKLDDGKEEGFWHLITKDQYVNSLKTRLPDFARASRICWLKIIIENYDMDGVRCFKYLDGRGEYKVYLWIEDLDHIIILKQLRNAYFLITSFRIEEAWLASDLAKRQRKGEPL